MRTLKIIVASTRPGRVGKPVADWFLGVAKAHGKLDVSLLDLAEVALPLLDEPAHPRQRAYQHAHTKAWSAAVDGADAFVIVTPEYNFGAPAPLVNALDYLFHEWAYKPVGFVSYGGASGGVRSVQMIKQLVTTLKMVPLVEAVSIPFVHKRLNAGAFTGDDALEKSATTLLDELARWADALAVLRS